jgi:hypothetical protein
VLSNDLPDAKSALDVVYSKHSAYETFSDSLLQPALIEARPRFFQKGVKVY